MILMWEVLDFSGSLRKNTVSPVQPVHPSDY